MNRRGMLVQLAVAAVTLACAKRRRDDDARPSAPVGPATAATRAMPGDAAVSHRDVVLLLLDKGNVDIYLDPRRPGVVVPEKFRDDVRLILKIGRAMAVPIPDLRVTEKGVFATLSFDQQPFSCSIPWPAVFAVVGDDGKGWVWNENVPKELGDAGASDAAQ